MRFATLALESSVQTVISLLRLSVTVARLVCDWFREEKSVGIEHRLSCVLRFKNMRNRVETSMPIYE